MGTKLYQLQNSQPFAHLALALWVVYINLVQLWSAQSSAATVQGRNCKAHRPGPSASSRSLGVMGKVPGGPDSLPAEEKGIMNGEKQDNDNKSCFEVLNDEALL